MEGSNVDELNARLQSLEKRVYGERGQSSKPVKVLRFWDGKNIKRWFVLELVVVGELHVRG